MPLAHARALMPNAPHASEDPFAVGSRRGRRQWRPRFGTSPVQTHLPGKRPPKRQLEVSWGQGIQPTDRGHVEGLPPRLNPPERAICVKRNQVDMGAVDSVEGLVNLRKG